MQNLENNNQEAQFIQWCTHYHHMQQNYFNEEHKKHLQTYFKSSNYICHCQIMCRLHYTISEALQYPLIYHHFYNKCLIPTSMETEVCENILCKNSFSERYSKSNFIEIPIHLQLQCILVRKYLPIVIS